MIWQLLLQGTWGYRRVVKAFPTQHQILQPNGELNREALAAVVFNDVGARRRLNKATHLPVLFGIIKQVIGHWITFKPVLVIDMPLLFETGFFRLTRPNILVTCPPRVQLQRLKERNNMTDDEATARITSQMSVEQKLQLADIVINNDGTLEELQSKVQIIEQQQLQKGRWLHTLAFSPAGVVTLAALLWRVFS